MRRRDFIVGTTAAAVLSGCKPGLQFSEGTDFDTVLERLHTTDSLIGNFTNHGAMIAEALVALGHPEHIVPMLNEYSREFLPLPEGEPIPVADRPAAVGHEDLRGAWIATFVEEAQTTDPSVILQREWPSVRAGFVADLFHGPIRVGQALRSLARADTKERRIEFGHALGHWLALDLTVPGQPGANPTPGLDVVQALNAIPLVPTAERVNGHFAEMIAVLNGRADFVAAVEAVDFSVWPLERSITELTAACARWFCQQSGIDPLHCVTGTSALRLLLPSLTPAQQQEGLRAAFHAVAATYAVAAKQAGIPGSVTASTSSFAAQIDRAAHSMDGHVIKLVEACRRESELDPRPEFLAAAAKWKA